MISLLFSQLLDSLGLHRVENRSHTVPAVSLHLYVPPFDRCHVFDESTGLFVLKKKVSCLTDD